MAVAMLPREKESWNDDRLDDLNQKVDEGFMEMREEFRAVRSEMAANHRATNQMIATMWASSTVGLLGVIATILVKV
jgi:hypothetical protein